MIAEARRWPEALRRGKWGSIGSRVITFCEEIAMTDLSTYNLESLHKDAGLVLYRGWKKEGPGQVLVSLPEAESPGREVLKRLEREYRLRAELDRAWAICPVDLIREKGQIALVLEDPGAEPLGGS